MASPAPVQKSTREETFAQLCKDFKLDEKVCKLILDTSIQNLEELRFYFVKEDEVATFLATLALGGTDQHPGGPPAPGVARRPAHGLASGG